MLMGTLLFYALISIVVLVALFVAGSLYLLMRYSQDDDD
jgi:hypothetical protein